MSREPTGHPDVRTGDDGVARCWWCGNDLEYVRYHDEEWGRPVADDHRLFEKICLEGFQAGLSWLTILRKRDNFRRAFADFDFEKVARFNRRSVDRLLSDAGIIRHRGKIEATINNARRAIELVGEHDSIAAYVWSFEPPTGYAPRDRTHIPATTQVATALSKDLRGRGWRFVGPTTAYAFMQAMGLVNDHLAGCAIRTNAEADRRAFRAPCPA